MSKKADSPPRRELAMNTLGVARAGLLAMALAACGARTLGDDTAPLSLEDACSEACETVLTCEPGAYSSFELCMKFCKAAVPTQDCEGAYADLMACVGELTCDELATLRITAGHGKGPCNAEYEEAHKDACE